MMATLEPKSVKQENDIQKLLRAYKIVKEFEGDHKEWAKTYFKIYCRDAKNLLSVAGSLEKAVECLGDEGEILKSKGFEWNLGTIARRYADWNKKRSSESA